MRWKRKNKEKGEGLQCSNCKMIFPEGYARWEHIGIDNEITAPLCKECAEIRGKELTNDT